jgi:hypothetical protein
MVKTITILKEEAILIFATAMICEAIDLLKEAVLIMPMSWF